jgi:DNA recombination protein RmuC
MLTALIVTLIVAVSALAVVLAVRGGKNSAAEVQNLRAELSASREAAQQSLDTLTMLVTAQIDRLNDNSSAMRNTSQEINSRMTGVQNTFADLQKQVGEMTGQARQISEVSRSISELQRIFGAPKQRGSFGETQLENLLATVFPREQYQMQYRFPSGDIADAVLFFAQTMVAIDSKFSLENFRRIAAAASEADAKTARRDFLRDVKKRVEEIAARYIRPGDGTLPFAIMYVPAENVFYEVIIRDEEGNDLYAFCMQKRVFPVSPNSLYAYLQTIMMGLNSMRISQRAEAVLREIQSLHVELGKFAEVYNKLGGHLRNAARSYEDSTREFSAIENRVRALGTGQAEQMTLLSGNRKSIGVGEG